MPAYAVEEAKEHIEKNSCYCQPIRAAQSPQECRLQTDFPLPWTPRGPSRQAPPPNPALPYNHIGLQNQGQTESTIGVQADKHNSGIALDGKWPTLEFNHAQTVPQKPHPPPLGQGGYPMQVPRLNNNGFLQESGMPYQQLPVLDQSSSEAIPSNISSPAKAPSFKKQGSCCHSEPEKESVTKGFPNTQQSQSQPFDGESHHDPLQLHYPNGFITDSNEPFQDAEMIVPSGGYGDSNYSGLNTYALPFMGDIEFCRANLHVLAIP